MSINTIYNFKAAVNDYARPNRYAVSLPIKIVDWDKLKDPRKVALNCNSVTWPARNIGTIDDRITGPLVKVPYDRIYQPVTMSFYLDAEMREWEVFNTWMNNITEKQIDSRNSDDIQDGIPPQIIKSKYMEYYSRFTTDIEIAQVDMVGKKTRIVTLKEAYPISISEIGMAYESSDTISTFNVSLTYKYFESREGLFNLSTAFESLPSELFGFVKNSLGIHGNTQYDDLITRKLIAGASSINKEGTSQSRIN